MSEQPSSSLPEPISVSEDLEVLSVFIISLAHRLANELGLARFDLMLVQRRLEDLGSEDATSIRGELAEVERRVDEALTLVTRVGEAQRPLQVERCDLNMLLSDALKAQSFPDNVQVRIHHEEDGELIVVGSVQLMEVFRNLMENAVAAMPDGGRMDIFLKTVDRQTGKHIQVQVSDTGTGIPEGVKKALFKEILGGPRKGGHGVGLWMSKILMRRLGGDIDLVESKPGQGTTFLITIPMAADELEDMTTDERSKHSGG